MEVPLVTELAIKVVFRCWNMAPKACLHNYCFTLRDTLLLKPASRKGVKATQYITSNQLVFTRQRIKMPDKGFLNQLFVSVLLG